MEDIEAEDAMKEMMGFSSFGSNKRQKLDPDTKNPQTSKSCKPPHSLDPRHEFCSTIKTCEWLDCYGKSCRKLLFPNAITTQIPVFEHCKKLLFAFPKTYLHSLSPKVNSLMDQHISFAQLNVTSFFNPA